MTLVTKIKEMTEEKEIILSKISMLEVPFPYILLMFKKREKIAAEQELSVGGIEKDDAGSEDSAKKKRTRKRKEEVERAFECPVSACGKAYG
jgi:hypothetical protein